MCGGGGSPQFDVGELQVSHDLQLVDAAEVLHAVPELKQVGPVDRQLELVGLTEEEDLAEGRRKALHFPVCPQPPTPNIWNPSAARIGLPQSTPPRRRGRRAARAPPDPRSRPGKSS